MQSFVAYQTPLAALDITLVGLPVTAALSAVALIGYLFGQRTRRASDIALNDLRRAELDRATTFSRKLESIADDLRQHLASHHARIEVFKRRLHDAKCIPNDQSWLLLCAEAESVLGPTMEFAQQLSNAYDQIRQQTGALEAFTRGRIDPLTGAGTGRALEQRLQVLLDARARGGGDFALALVGLNCNRELAELPARTEVLLKLATTIRHCLRDSDFVARLGDEEFVILLPSTSLSGASVFGERLLKHLAEKVNLTVACGLAESRDTDDMKSILARADSAYYSAKAAGPNRLFVHTGAQIREHSCTPCQSPQNPKPSATVVRCVDVSPNNDVNKNDRDTSSENRDRNAPELDDAMETRVHALR